MDTRTDSAKDPRVIRRDATPAPPGSPASPVSFWRADFHVRLPVFRFPAANPDRIAVSARRFPVSFSVSGCKSRFHWGFRFPVSFPVSGFRFPVFLAFLLLLLPALLRADLVISQKVEGQRSGTVTLRFQGDKVRVDVAPELSSITDTASGEVLTLMHSTHSYMRLSADSIRGLADRKSGSKPDGAPPKMVPTGRTETVAGYPCEVYTWKNGSVTATYWIARDYPNYAVIRDAMERFQNSGLGMVTRGLGPEIADIPGMVLRSELAVGKQRITTTVESVSNEGIDPATFNVPDGYREVLRPHFD